MKNLILFIHCIFAVQGTHSKLTAEVNKLFNDYHDWKMVTNPQAATYAGFHQYADKLDDFSLEALQNVGVKCEYFKERAQKILEWPQLLQRDKFYVKILEDETSMCSKGMAYRGYYLAPVDHLSGVQTNLGRFFGEDNVQKLQNEKDYRTLIRRLKKVPKQIDQIIELLKHGIEEGITYSNESMFRTKDQFKLLQVPVEQSVFFKQFKKMPAKLQLSAYSTLVVEIQFEAKDVISNKVLPSFKKLEKFLDETYMKHLRPNPALSSLPNGIELYKGFLDYHTTLSGLTAEYIHEMGTKEVENLKRKMMEVATQLGFGKEDLTDFLKAIRDDPEQQFTSRVEKLQCFEDNVDIINTKLRSFFGPQVLHDEVYDISVKPMPSKKNFRSYYSPPSLDGERLGAFYINVDDIGALKKYETMTLTLHESNPGHHLQETYAKFSDIPDFLKLRVDSWYTPGAPPTYTAFVEGWAQYAEHLGFEMKVFEDDPYQKIGFYSFDLVRSMRLVLDTGIHAYGWSREKAIEYLVDNSAMSIQNCIDEVDRYITWPGHAIAYEIGEQRIFQLRRKFQKQQGKAFDIRKFHWHLLSCMGPLESLEECIDEREWHHSKAGASLINTTTYFMLLLTSLPIFISLQ